MEIKELIEQVKAASESLKAAQEKHDAEMKAHGEASVETKAAVEAMAAELKEAGEKMIALDKKLIELELEAKRFREAGQVGKKSLGAVFVESDVYEGVKNSGRGNNAPVSIARKDITGLSTSAGALVRADRDPEVYGSPRRATRIRDLIPATPVQGGSVEVMRLATVTNNAGPQQAGSEPSNAVGGGELQLKNKSDYVWELVTYPVRTIAHWVPASRQVLSDAPMLQSVIDSELVYGLDLESDEQLLLGDGTGQNVVGLLVDLDIEDIGGLPAGTTNTSAAMIDHIRAAVTDLQTREYYNPNGIVMNPVDWGNIETAKDNSGQYLMLQFPAEGARERIWRMPVVVTNAMPQGEFIVGDWQMGARLYEREDVQVRVSESHADLFVRNGVAILAEERYAFAIPRPNAFTKGSFDVEAS